MSAYGVPPAALALRGVVLLAPVLALLSTGLQGPWPRPFLVAVVVAVSAGFAVLPDSHLGTVSLGLVVIWWGLAVRTHLPVAVVPAAWLLLGAHLAAVVLTHGPKELPVETRLLRRWLGRGALLALVAPGLWLLGRAVAGQPEPTGIWVAGLVAAVVVCVVAAAAVTAASTTT